MRTGDAKIEQPVLPFTYTFDRSLLLFWILFPLALTGILLAIMATGHDGLSTAAILWSFVPCYIFYPLAFGRLLFNVIFGERHIVIASLFGRRKVEYGEILKVDIRHEINHVNGVKADYLWLLLTLISDSKPLQVAMSHNEPHMPVLLNILAEKAPGAEFSELAMQIKNSNIP